MRASIRLRQLHSVLRQPSSKQTLSHTTPPPPPPTPDLFKVTPKVSLFDQIIDIRVHGLPSKVKVTLHAVVEATWRRERVQFASCGHYVTDEHGMVDISKDESLGGTYTGVEPMGLFASMEASPAGPRNIRMVHRNVERPLSYNLSVYLGHLSLSDLHVTQPSPRPLAVTTLQRLVKGAEVRRLPIKEGCVRGTLFLPPGEGPFPGVIDMFGFAGGLMESRAAMMASRGFAALALPFFNYQDLPATVEDVNFNYFEETVNWFASHSSVKKGGIGVVAVSGGATFALLMGWKLSQVLAVVLINSPIFYVLPDLYCGDRHFIRGGEMNKERAIMTSEGLLVKNAWMYTEDVFIPIWESSTRVLALISEDDGQVPPQLGDKLQTMYPEERRHLIEVVHYPGAGHLLEPPYTPHCRFCFNPPSGSDLLWGGRKKEHAKAQEDAWHRIITILHTHLPSS